jgi:uncharacterized protein YndB with AHSA1/START domain
METARWKLAAIVLLSCCASAQTKTLHTTADVRNTSYVAAGQRVLRHEVIVPANLQQVWHAFTTQEGLQTWAAPVVEFELKTGGSFHSNYNPQAKLGDTGTIYNTVLSYIPLRMLTFKIGLTPAFPEGPRQAGTLFAVAEFAAIGANKTKVTLSMAGWGSGDEWNRVYSFFESGDPIALHDLKESFVHGPINWNKQRASDEAAR